MYTFAILTALAATAAASKLGARQQDPLGADSVNVLLNSETLGVTAILEPPETAAVNGDFIGPYLNVTLTLGTGIDDVTTPFRCQMLDTAGNVVRVNRGKNLNKSTFSKGLPWTMSSGTLTEIGTIICPVAAPPGE